MRNFFTLTLLSLLLAIGTSAQEKKTWDFSKGWSDETLANLAAGSEWNADGTSWKETGKFGSGAFVANGEPIKELAGLERSSAGLSKNNNYLLTPTTFRLNRNNMELIFPSLKNGQKLTIQGRSANGTANNRGVKGKYDYMVRVDDDKDNNIMLGGGVEGSKGTYTFVYEIQTSETGEVPVAIQMITGGIDFTLFMIDDGDEIKTTKIAYLYDGTDDAVLSALKAREASEVTPINVTATTVTAEELRGFDVTVIGASVPADNAAVAVVKDAMPFTPVLNLNANMYAVWTYGAAVEALGVGVVKSAKHALLNGANVQEADGTNFIELGEGNVQAITLGDYFAGDNIPLKAMSLEGAESDEAIIHTHNEKHNGYVYAPYSANMSADLLTIYQNAITMLAESKAEVTAAAKPVVKQEFKDQQTIVTIEAGRQLPKTRFFYTTDGSEPTLNSSEYTEPFILTTPSTVKAVAIAEGYNLSEVAQLAIEIHEQPKTPVIAYEQEDGKTTVTASCESEDVQIWYNFESEATNDTLKSTKYSKPFVITMPQYVNVFAIAGKAVWSEVASQRILVKNPRVVIDVAGHFQAQQWTAENNPAGLAVANGKGMFSWGASAATMYTGEGVTETITDPETGDEIQKTTYSPEDMREPEVVNEPGENPAWVLKSRGTCLIWQNLSPTNTNFGNNEDAYNPSASTDVDPLFPVSKNNIQFYKFFEGEPGNGSIETLNKYQAPLDVVVLANMQGGPLLVQVSADGTEWTTIGEIAKTGYSRMWGKYTAMYNGTDEVYVRLTQEEAAGGAKIFDIYIANQGEQSLALLQQLNEELTGIADVKQAVNVAEGIYNLSGMRQNGLKTGLNIVVKDGVVRKIIVK